MSLLLVIMKYFLYKLSPSLKIMMVINIYVVVFSFSPLYICELSVTSLPNDNFTKKKVIWVWGDNNHSFITICDFLHPRKSIP